MENRLFEFLGPELLPMYLDGEKLLAEVPTDLSDYSFAVFPFAKVYEGFLKKLFFKIGAITLSQYESDHWRVGRALNPQLEKDLRHMDSVYDRIADLCSETLPETLWQTWKKGRNQIFHYWPGKSKALSLERAKEIIDEIKKTMEMSLVECKV